MKKITPLISVVLGSMLLIFIYINSPGAIPANDTSSNTPQIESQTSEYQTERHQAECDTSKNYRRINVKRLKPKEDCLRELKDEIEDLNRMKSELGNENDFLKNNIGELQAKIKEFKIVNGELKPFSLDPLKKVDEKVKITIPRFRIKGDFISVVNELMTFSKRMDPENEGVQIFNLSSVAEDKIFSFDFENLSIEEIAKYLSLTTHLEYKITEEGIFLGHMNQLNQIKIKEITKIVKPKVKQETEEERIVSQIEMNNLWDNPFAKDIPNREHSITAIYDEKRDNDRVAQGENQITQEVEDLRKEIKSIQFYIEEYTKENDILINRKTSLLDKLYILQHM